MSSILMLGEQILGHRGGVRQEIDEGNEVMRTSALFDLVLCAGGLYHISDPGRLLEGVGGVSRGYVLIQSVVTLETEDPHYFVEPAPGWQHGCRFTHAWLREKTMALGWRIVAESRAELPGNPNPRDRGASFFLCEVGPSFVPAARLMGP
jgi:hypothetical protein